MPNEWITAATALRYLSDQPYTYNEERAICERAHSGLIATRAETLIWNGEERRLAKIPNEFWWAEGQDALTQNWETGDFSTWIDRKFEVKAFGVSFDFLAIADLIPAEKRAAGMQRISVAADPHWLPARDLTRLLYAKINPARAGSMVIEACALGQLSARAAHAAGSISIRDRNRSSFEWAAFEWDVPIWFWRDFTKAGESTQDWQLGKASGKGLRDGASETISLQGLHFHRSGLAFLGLDGLEGEDDAQARSNRGRRPKYDWPAASAAIWGKIFRGDLQPGTQADIERAFQIHLAAGDREPSESTVRPFAKIIWDEFQKA